MVTGNGWTLWKAIDETLARPVSVLTFASGFPRIPQVVTAARAASRLTDPRMAQVFDVEDGGGQAYIVLEWVGGDSLTEILDAGGPLDSARACSLICDASRAVAGAHALGQAHLRLTPDTLRWTRGSGIKITGVGIDAALAGDGLTGDAARDPSIADTTALAALLYAALTGYWPGEEPTRLPAAPVSDGVVCTPRQVSADVSSAIDSVIIRALLQRPTRHGGPIQSPAEFADALAAVAPPAPLPEPAPPAPAGYQGRGGYDGYGGGYGPDPNNPDSWSVPGPSGTAPYQSPAQQYPAAGYGGAQYTGAQYSAAGYQREKRGVSRVTLTVVVVLVLAVVAVLVWAVGFRKSPSSTAGGGGSHATTSASAAAGGTVLTPASDSTFNIYGSPPGNTENQATAALAIDNNPSTAWSTSYYIGSPKFGGLKPGTGLLIDMGKQVRLSQVEVLLSSTGGPTTASIYLGNSPAMSKSALSDFTLVSPSASASGDHTFPVSSQATGRYVLVWLTSLPKLSKTPQGAGGGNTYYEGQVYNVVVRGSSVSGTS
jgi:serine/threonine protein kinase